MNKVLCAILLACTFMSPAFSQSKKEMKKNLDVSVIGYIDPKCFFSFDRKNPDKHGFDYVVEKFTKSFKKKGLNVAVTPHHYSIVMDYEYGYIIAAYKWQYKNLIASIVDVDNGNEPVGTITYQGRYENDEIADVIADRLKAIINDPAMQKRQVITQPVKSKEDQLIELKSLLDKGLITQDDYDSQKGKILNEQ